MPPYRDKMLRIFKVFIISCALLAVSFLGAAASAHAAQGPTDSWDNGEGSVFTEPKSFIEYNREKGDEIQPLPKIRQHSQQEAFSLGWSLRIVSKPQDDANADSEVPPEETDEGGTEDPDITMPGAEFGDAFGTLLVQPSLKSSGLQSSTITPQRAPDWLKESPLWLFVRLSPNVENSYFYAPFAAGQSAQERLETAGAVMPTSIEIIDESGEPVAGVQVYYPSGRMKQDIFSSLHLPVYQGEVLVAASIPGRLLGQKLQLKVNALLCTDVSCTPFRKFYSLSLNTADIAADPLEPSLFAALADYQTAPFGDVAAPDEDEPQEQRPARTIPAMLGNATGQAGLEGWLASYMGSLRPHYHVDFLEVANIWRAVLMGLLAGLILNFMPCVLPVISLKLSALLGLGGWQGLEAGSEEAARGRRRFRLYGFCYTLGVFVWFGILFGVLGFAGLLWGQLFQSQELILALAILLFVLALSMFGLVRIPFLNVQISTKAGLPHQAFFGGLLATLLATPCSGPLLGGVLGWAVNQSLPYLGASLFSVAVGMSSPFILMTISPGLARFLPKPGPWAITLERFMGFVLLGTVIYLLSMLTQTKIFTVLAALLTLAFSAWLWSRPIAEGKSRFTLSRALALILIVPALYFPFNQRSVDTSWKEFNAVSFRDDVGKRNLLLDFTADWCINCRAMEVTTLTGQRLARWAREYDLTYVKVDLTGDNPDGSDLLRALGSASIPLLAIIAADNPYNPTVLRDLVSPAQLDRALEQAFQR